MSEEQIIELLGECTLFMGMNNLEISRVLSGHLGRIKSYSRNVLIAQAGDEVRFLHILLQGTVKGEMVDYTGKVTLLIVAITLLLIVFDGSNGTNSEAFEGLAEKLS